MRWTIVGVVLSQARCAVRGVVAAVVFLPLWSSGAVAATFGLAYISPQAFLALRAAGAAAGTWILVALTRQRLPSRHQLRATVVAGLFLQVGYQGFFFMALALGISPALLAIVVSAQPLLTSLVDRHGCPRGIIGVLVGMAGVAIAVSGGLSAGEVTTWAVLCAVAAVASISIGTVIQARERHVGIWASLAVQSTVSVALFAVVVGVAGLGRFDFTAVAAVSVGWLIVVVSIVATALLYSIAQTRGALTISALMLLVPVTTAIEDFLLRGTTLTSAVIAGGAVTAVGLALVLPTAAAQQKPPTNHSPLQEVSG